MEWQQVHEEAAEALKTSCEKLKDPSEKDLENREQRGHFPQKAVGESMGGGQKVEYYSLYLHIVECTTNSLLRCVGSRDAQVHKQDCFRLHSVSYVHHMHHWLSIRYVCYAVHFSYSN